MTTINELIETLENLRDDIDATFNVDGDVDAGEIQVLVAFQQNYPLAGGVATVSFIQEDMTEEYDPAGPGRVWLAVGSAPYGVNPYAPSAAWEGGIVERDEECADV